jgi:hypothetical protein
MQIILTNIHILRYFRLPEMTELLKTSGQAFCCGVIGNPRAKLDFNFSVSCIHRFIMGDMTLVPFYTSYFVYSLLPDLHIITKEQLNTLKSEYELRQCYDASKVSFSYLSRSLLVILITIACDTS